MKAIAASAKRAEMITTLVTMEDLRAEESAVLADASREDDEIRSAESDEILTDEIGNPPSEEIAGDDRSLVARFDGGFDVTGIV